MTNLIFGGGITSKLSESVQNRHFVLQNFVAVFNTLRIPQNSKSLIKALFVTSALELYQIPNGMSEMRNKNIQLCAFPSMIRNSHKHISNLRIPDMYKTLALSATISRTAANIQRGHTND